MRHLLFLQDKAVDYGIALPRQASTPSLRQNAHCHLARKLATLQKLGLKINFPEEHAGLTGNALSQTLAN